MRALAAAALWTASVALADEPVFLDGAERAGLSFNHRSGASGEYYMPEIMGSGVALLDYDGDGDLDVYLLQGAALDPAASPDGPTYRLFRNLLIESGELRFEDVTARAGVGRRGFGMGAAVGDIDNDGDPDLFISNFGPDALYLNNGDGSFTDVTAASGLGDEAFGTSAAFLDFDGDGLLDLFLTRYNAFTVAGSKRCSGAGGGRDYCGPLEYAPLPDRLYRNLGDGRFQDVSIEAGLGEAYGAGLGVAAADFNGDGLVDVYVANDRSANQLWINQGDGTFRDEALASGAALNADGMAEAGMGVAVGDYDDDGDPDLFLTHITVETNTLYRNDGAGLFEDVTDAVGLGAASVAATGFGAEWLDYDNDGRLDLFAANGLVIRAVGPGADGYRQPNQLFRNLGDGRFEDVSRKAGAAVLAPLTSRGAAVGDLDNDGDLDVVVSNIDGPAQLLLNQIGSREKWLRVRLRGTASNRDARVSRVGVRLSDGSRRWRWAGAAGSYLSASDPRLLFGLGDLEPREIVVDWPDGESEFWALDGSEREFTLVQGTGGKR